MCVELLQQLLLILVSQCCDLLLTVDDWDQMFV